MRPGGTIRLRPFVATLALAALAAAPAAAQDTGWTIESFHADYTVHEDRSIGVVERIEVDFQDLRRHGIYRTIPVRYKRLVRSDLPIEAGRVETGLRVRRVTDGSGRRIPYETSGGGVKEIKIGDPGRTVTGRQTYVIDYVLSKGLGFFETHDELYWQVTGTEWPVPIGRASATVTLPAGRVSAFADSTPWQVHCYAGGAASTSDARCTAEIAGPGDYRFATTGALAPGEGLTLAAGFPKGVIAPPPTIERAQEGILRWGPLAIPVLAFVLLFSWWRRHGREPPIGSVVPVWRPSDELRPGTAGTLVDQKADMDDVIATILDLAARGYLRIDEVAPEIPLGLAPDSVAGKLLGGVLSRKKDWELSRLRQAEEAGLLQFERNTLSALFKAGSATQRMSDLKNEFYTSIPHIKQGIYADLVTRGFFGRSPASTRTRWMVFGALVAVSGVALGITALSRGYWTVLPALVLSGVFALAFGWHMPAMTAVGARARREVEGLKEYIRRAEKQEIEFRDAPEKTPELFSALLPYAVALDVTDLWVRQFDGILTKPPEWYGGSSVQGFSRGGFGNALSGFNSAAAATLASSPGSSSGSGGGGSVGGGGGGGGGGSW